jgi:hypothetical protein
LAHLASAPHGGELLNVVSFDVTEAGSAFNIIDLQ